MNINEHPIYKDIYDLCQEIEKLPASEQATKIVIMAGNLEKPAAKLIDALRKIRDFPIHSEPVGAAHSMQETASIGLC